MRLEGNTGRYKPLRGAYVQSRSQSKPRKQGAQPTTGEIITEFFDQSKTRTAPVWHWHEELRSYLEAKGIVKNGRFKGASFSGVLPGIFNSVLREMLKNRDFSKRLVDESSAIKMQSLKPAGIGPLNVEDRVRQALFHHGVMVSATSVNTPELARKLGLKEGHIRSIITRDIPLDERIRLVQAGMRYREKRGQKKS